MNSLKQRSVLIVEDDENWRELYQEECQKRGWRHIAFDNVPQALRLIESSDPRMFDIAIVDKGGSNALRGKPDIIAHRDGLTVLRTLKEHQPTCVRMLSTGESWSPELFSDPTLALHIFIDKGFGDLGAAFKTVEGWRVPPALDKPIIFGNERFSRSSEIM